MVQIEIEDPAMALKILARLTVDNPTLRSIPTNSACVAWKYNLKNKIEAAMLEEAENTWKHLSSWDIDGVYIEINEFGDVRVEEKIFKPRFDRTDNEWVTTFVTQEGHVNTIDPIHFVKVHFDKDLEL
jgi:hypothetical protein